MSAALLTSAALCANAYDFEVDGIYYNILSSTDRTVEVTYKDLSQNRDNYYSGEIVIPDKVTYSGTGFTVTAVGEKAFYYSTELTGVRIPNSVVIIGGDAFEGCSQLKTIDLGNSIVSIGQGAFHYCKKLTDIIIPNSVTTIGPCAFESCESFKSIVVPSSVTSIGMGIFALCKSLVSVVLPEGITEIPEHMFYRCSSLKSIVIPSTVTSISSGAFQDSGLESIVIPPSVIDLGFELFRDCTSLTSIKSLNPTPPTAYSDSFQNVNKFQCKVYVPEGSVDAYKSAEGWKDFLLIEPISDSGVDEMGVDAEGVTAVEYYDMQGVRLDAPAKGVNIVVYSDSTRRKVVL